MLIRSHFGSHSFASVYVNTCSLLQHHAPTPQSKLVRLHFGSHSFASMYVNACSLLHHHAPVQRPMLAVMMQLGGVNEILMLDNITRTPENPRRYQ